jgi:hypothetical protein
MFEAHDDENETEPSFGPVPPQRDWPLGLCWRVADGARAMPALPPCRNTCYQDAVHGVLTEALLAAEAGRWVSYSRRPASYAGQRRYRGNSFTRRCVLAAVDAGATADLLLEERASPGARGWQSRFTATPLLCEQMAELDFAFHQHESIWLKDEDRRAIPYGDTDLTRHLRNELDAINQAISSIQVGFAGGGIKREGRGWLVDDTYVLPTPPHLRRIFNRGSFDCGGRAFGWWQGLKPVHRAMMTLNGEPVLEPDYAALHATVIYAQRGSVFAEDPYETHEFPRQYGESAFNIALNAENKRDAIGAISNKLKIDRSTASRLLSSIIHKHKPIADVFASDAGIRLMRLDSDITITAVKRCLSKGIAVLPVHDSLVVPARLAEQTAEIMVTAFASRFPKSPPCKVTIKDRNVSTYGEDAPYGLHSGRIRD